MSDVTTRQCTPARQHVMNCNIPKANANKWECFKCLYWETKRAPYTGMNARDALPTKAIHKAGLLTIKGPNAQIVSENIFLFRTMDDRFYPCYPPWISSTSGYAPQSNAISQDWELVPPSNGKPIDENSPLKWIDKEPTEMMTIETFETQPICIAVCPNTDTVYFEQGFYYTVTGIEGYFWWDIEFDSKCDEKGNVIERDPRDESGSLSDFIAKRIARALFDIGATPSVNNIREIRKTVSWDILKVTFPMGSVHECPSVDIDFIESAWTPTSTYLGLHGSLIKKKCNELQGVIVPDETPYEGQTNDLQEAVLARLLERGVRPKDVEILRMYCEGVGQDGIGETVGLSQAAISKRLKLIGRYNIGFAFEDVYSAMLTRDGIRHIKEGDNTPNPDIVILDENDNPVEVLSLKAYISKRPTVTIGFNDIAVSELEMRDEHRIPLNLLFYDIVVDRLHAKVLVTDQERFTFRRKAK